jgi:hypothetical protein
VVGRTHKLCWGLACLIPIVILIPISILAVSGYWLDGQHDSTYQPALVLAYASFAVYFAAMVGALIHVARRDDLGGNGRAKWILGMVLLNGLLLPVFWWKLIRPLPEVAQAGEVV